eukprot:4409221-Prorocentrum_lima.AAC.1
MRRRLTGKADNEKVLTGVACRMSGLSELTGHDTRVSFSPTLIEQEDKDLEEAYNEEDMELGKDNEEDMELGNGWKTSYRRTQPDKICTEQW